MPKKITELNALAFGDISTADDVIPIVDASEPDLSLKNKKVTVSSLLKSGGFPNSYSATFGNGSDTEFVFLQSTHGLDPSRALIARVYDESTGDEEEVKINIDPTGTGTVTLEFNTAPLTNSKRIVIVG